MDSLALYNSDSEEGSAGSQQEAAEPDQACLQLGKADAAVLPTLHPGRETAGPPSKRRKVGAAAGGAGHAAPSLPTALPSAADLLAQREHHGFLFIELSLFIVFLLLKTSRTWFAVAAVDEPGPVRSCATSASAGDRVRSFPHVEGNFATSVYIPVQLTEELRAFTAAALQALRVHVPGLKATQEATQGSEGSCRTGAAAPSSVNVRPSRAVAHPPSASQRQTSPAPSVDHHVSLSRTVPVRMPQIETLMEALRRGARRFSACDAGLSGLKVFVNDEGTRTFIALKIEQGSEAVCRMIAAVDKAFVMHGLQRFYAEPQPHISFGWVAGDCRPVLEPAAHAVSQTCLFRGRPLGDAHFKLKLRSVLCRIGQRVNRVWEVP